MSAGIEKERKALLERGALVAVVARGAEQQAGDSAGRHENASDDEQPDEDNQDVEREYPRSEHR